MSTRDRREYQRTWKANRRREMIEYLGGKCVICGTTENLEFHHRNPADKSFDPGSQAGRRWESLYAELAKCEVRCCKHHEEAHAAPHGVYRYNSHHKCRCDVCAEANRRYRGYEKFKPAEHGSRSLYSKKGCRCDLCRAAQSAYRIAYYHRKKQEVHVCA